MRSRHLTNRIKNAVDSVRFEPLESRAYLSAVSLGTPVNLDPAGLGLSPVQNLLADVNADGKADLVVANSTGSVSVLTSKGDGSFASPATAAVLGTPVALATGVFDTTGNIGIVVGTAGSPGNVSIIPGNGDGTFAAANNIAALDNNSSIAVGDFNNDGNADILTVSNSAAATNNAMLLLGNGTAGAFPQAPFSLPFGRVSAVVAGDFNGDGNLDFAVSNQLDNSISLFSGHGDGTFAAPVRFATGNAPMAMIAGNFTGQTLANGKPELDIVTADSTSGTISFLAGKSDGTFAAAVHSTVAGSAAGGGPIALSSGDFNHDGHPDVLALLSAGSSAKAVVLLGNGSATFTADASVASNAVTSSSISAGDMNGDGYSDALLSSAAQISSILTAANIGQSVSTTTLQTSATSVTAGNSVTLTATVADPTSAGLPTGSVTFSANGIALGTAPLVNGVATLPASLTTAGTDSITASYAGDATFSASASAAVVVTVSPGSVSGSSLSAAILKSKLPTAIVAGTKASGSAQVAVTNSTGLSIKGPITVNLYAAINEVVDGSAVLIGSVRKTLSFKPGKTLNLSIPAKLAATVAAADYSLIAQVVDPESVISSSAAGQHVVVAPAFIALAGSFVKVTAPASIVTNTKVPATVQLKITNNGNVTSAGSTPIGFYVSTDGISAGTLITTLTRKLSIRAGKSVTLKVPLSKFPDVVDGEYFIVAQITDPKAAVTSSASPATLSIAKAKIDLAASAITAPAKAAPGKPISIGLSVSNLGNVTALGQVVVVVTATTGGVSMQLDTTSVHINLKPARAQKLHTKVLLPAGLPAGSYTLSVTLDPDNVYSDPDLTNNSATSAGLITVSGAFVFHP